MSKQKLQIGLITQGRTIPAWAFTLLQSINQSDYAELNLLILQHQTNKRKPQKKILQKFRFLLYFLHQTFEKIAFKPKPDAFKQYPLSNVKDCEIIEFNPDKETKSTFKQKRELILLKGIDVFIALTPLPTKNIFSELSRYGLWTAEPPLQSHLATSVAAVWEVLQQKPVTELFLTIRDKQPVRFKATFATIKNSIRWNRSFYYWKAMCIIQAKLEQLYKLGWDKLLSIAERPDKEITTEMPGNLAVLTGSIRVFYSFLTGKARNMLSREQWSILYSFENKHINGLEGFQRITPPKDRLWADPFVINKENKTYIFAEEMEFSKGKGKIIVTQTDKPGLQGKPITVLEENHHLSYPYLFEDNGELFMIPETSQKRTIELYKCDIFPNSWTHVKTILSGLEAADASLLKYNDTYWLFANVRMHEGVSINDDLFLFFSKDLCGDEWIPHPMNPIVSDVRFSRPAGQIAIRDNRLIRPAQDCSKRYGYAIQLMEIEKISETDYREKLVKTFLPNWKNDVLGIHTFNQTDRVTVADALIRRKKF